MSGATLAAVVSACAALVAATLAGVNLYTSRRDKDLERFREATTEALVGFITACYSHRHAVNRMAAVGVDPESRHAQKNWQAAADEAFHAMMDAVSRLRVLTTDEFTEVALRVAEHNDKAIKMVWAGQLQEFAQTKEQRHDAFIQDRDRFTAASRRILKTGTKRLVE